MFRSHRGSLLQSQETNPSVDIQWIYSISHDRIHVIKHTDIFYIKWLRAFPFGCGYMRFLAFYSIYLCVVWASNFVPSTWGRLLPTRDAAISLPSIPESSLCTIDKYLIMRYISTEGFVSWPWRSDPPLAAKHGYLYPNLQVYVDSHTINYTPHQKFCDVFIFAVLWYMAFYFYRVYFFVIIPYSCWESYVLVPM